MRSRTRVVAQHSCARHRQMKRRPRTGGVPDVVQDETHRETEQVASSKTQRGILSHPASAERAGFSTRVYRPPEGFSRTIRASGGASQVSISQQNPVRVFVSHARAVGRLSPRVRIPGKLAQFFLSQLQRSGAARHGRARQAEGRAASADRARRSRHRAFGPVRRAPRMDRFPAQLRQGLDKPVIVLEAFGVKEKLPVQLEGRRDRGVERAVDRGRDPPPGASRGYDALGHHRLQTGLISLRRRRAASDVPRSGCAR